MERRAFISLLRRCGMMDAEIGGKRVQLLRELIPNLSRITVLATTPTTSPYSPPFVEHWALVKGPIRRACSACPAVSGGTHQTARSAVISPALTSSIWRRRPGKEQRTRSAPRPSPVDFIGPPLSIL